MDSSKCKLTLISAVTARAAGAVCLALLAACTPETSNDHGTSQGSTGKVASPGHSQGSEHGNLSNKARSPISPGVQQVAPTRSELRRMEEESNSAEANIQEHMQHFDANLGDPRERRKIEQDLKAALPEYKEKMLILGKSKLKDQE